MTEHLEHLEDLAFWLDDWDLRSLTTALIHRVYGAEIGHLSVKMDGAPAIVFGREWDPNSSTPSPFFLSTKSYFNKTPIKYHSLAEIEASGRDPELIKKLKHYWHCFHDQGDPREQVREGLIYIADVLRDPWCNIDGHRSRPNILEYKFSGIGGNDFFLCVHSILNTKRVPIAAEMYDPLRHAGPMLSHISGKLFSTSQGDKDSLACALRDLHLTEELSLPNYTEKEYKEHLQDINKCYREGKDPLQEFKQWYKGYRFHNWRVLANLKKQLLTKLDNERKSHNRSWQVYFNGEECPDEGYVFRYRDWTCKLVDRMTFSRRNFDPNTPRGWQKS